MMKKLLLPILCLGLLTGCDFSLEEPNGQQTFTFNDDTSSDTSTPTDTTQPEGSGENTNNNENTTPDETNTGDNGSDQNTNNNDNNTDDQSGSTDTTDIVIDENALTKTVSFYNGGFTNSSLNQAASMQSFIDWFNGEDDLLESVSYDGYCQLNYIGNEGDTNRFSTLILGSANNNGSLAFNFKYDVLSIKVNIQAYTKYISYGEVWNTDNNSCFYLDNNQYDLSTETGYSGDTPKQDAIINYSTPVKTVNISAYDGRVFVHSMEVIYKKDSA